MIDSIDWHGALLPPLIPRGLLRLVWRLGKYMSMTQRKSWLARGTLLVKGKTDKSADESRIYTSHKHTGPVRGLDFNPIQKNLLASGAVNAEVSPPELGRSKLTIDLHLRPKQPYQRPRHTRPSIQQARRDHIPAMEPYCRSYPRCILLIGIHFGMGFESW
jgi:hypothetical protein